MTSAVSPNPASDRVVRHPEYYITGGDVVFRVENTLFRCHRYFFTRDSAYFREKLPHPPPPGEFTKGSSDPNPFILEDTLKVDFERLLWVFYNPKYNIYEGSVEEWSSILKLAHQWGFVEVKAFALRELEQHEIPALQKILLYHAHDIDRDLLQAAYAALTARDEPISLDEGLQLGLETALQLARAREIARAPVFSGKKSGNPRSPVTLAGVELDALIKDLFQLSTPDTATERPPTPHTPTRRGTPTGRNTPQISIETHTNGTGSPASNSHRGGSVMRAYSSFSSHADLPAQVPPTGPTATQMEPPIAMAVAAAAAGKAAPTPPSGSRPIQDTGAVQRARDGAGSVAGVPSGPEPKGKEAAAAEASLDSVMHLLDISKRDSSVKKVVSDGHRSERVVSQARTDVVESKATTEAQGAASTLKSASNKKKGQGPARKSEAAEQGSGTVRPERTRAQSEQAAASTSAQETRSERSRSRTAEPTKKEQLQINTTVPGSEHPRRDSTPTPTRESSSFSFDEHTHRPVQHKKQSSSTTTPATTSSLFGFVSNLIGGGGDPGYESSSRESEDDTPMAGAWHSTKSRRDKAEAEARAKAQEATRLRLDAEAKERAEAEERARQEAEEARKIAEEEALLEAEKARKDEEKRARLEAEEARKDAEERARLEAEKARKDAEERTRLEAEKARKAEKEKARLEAEKARKDAEERTRLEAEKARKDKEEKTRLAAEEKTRKDAEKALAKKAKKAVAAAAKKREADAKAEADARAKAAEAETKRQAEAEAEKMKREAEAKAAKEKLEAEAKAEEARIKAKEDAENKAKAEEAKAKEAADREAEAKAAKEAKAIADAQADARAAEDAKAIADAQADARAAEDAKAIADAEAEARAADEAKAIADAQAEAKAAEEAKVIADAEAKATAEKAEQEAATMAATAKAESAVVEETKKEKERKRAEKLKEAGLQRAKAAEEQVAKQRAADKAARLAASSPAPSPISSRPSGGGWLFSKVTQAVSAIVTPGQADDPRSPSRPAATGSSDLFSRRPIKNLSSPNVELGPRNPFVMRQSTSNPFRDPLSSPSAAPGTAARSSISALSSGTTLVSEEVGTTEEKEEDVEGEGEGTQVRTASETPAGPSAEQAGGNEAKTQPAETQPAEAIADEQSTPDVEEPTQTGSDAAQPAVPDDSTEQSISSGPISSEADNTQEPESTPPNAAADPEARNTPEAPLTPPADAPVSPPVPAKDASVVNIPSPASQETSTSSAQTTDPAVSEAVGPDEAGETVAPSSEEGAAAAKGDNPDPEAVAKDPTAQSGVDDSHATGEGSTPPQGEDAKPEKPPKLTLPMDRVRQLSTATEMSSSSVETPADEAGSPAVEVEEEGGAGEPGTPGKPKKKKKSKKRRGEKNSPRSASGAAVNDVDNPIEQETKPVTSDPVDVPGGEGDGVLVDMADSSGEDSAVFVDASQAETEIEKAADATTSGSDEWNDWGDDREVLHN